MLFFFLKGPESSSLISSPSSQSLVTVRQRSNWLESGSFPPRRLPFPFLLSFLCSSADLSRLLGRSRSSWPGTDASQPLHSSVSPPPPLPALPHPLGTHAPFLPRCGPPLFPNIWKNKWRHLYNVISPLVIAKMTFCLVPPPPPPPHSHLFSPSFAPNTHTHIWTLLE